MAPKKPPAKKTAKKPAAAKKPAKKVAKKSTAKPAAKTAKKATKSAAACPPGCKPAKAPRKANKYNAAVKNAMSKNLKSFKYSTTDENGKTVTKTYNRMETILKDKSGKLKLDKDGNVRKLISYKSA